MCVSAVENLPISWCIGEKRINTFVTIQNLEWIRGVQIVSVPCNFYFCEGKCFAGEITSSFVANNYYSKA